MDPELCKGGGRTVRSVFWLNSLNNASDFLRLLLSEFPISQYRQERTSSNKLLTLHLWGGDSTVHILVSSYLMLNLTAAVINPASFYCRHIAA